MKIPCRKCKAEMKYPFRTCNKCGWKPEGPFRKKADAFARRYEKKHGIEPKTTEKKSKGSRPGVLRPPPGKDIHDDDGDDVPEMIACPKCGEDVLIPSSDRPIRLRCGNCRAKMKIID